MTPLRQLAVVEGKGALALLAFAGALTLLGVLMGSARSVSSAPAFFVIVVIIGAPFVVFYGAPAYWALLRHGKATWWSALVLGVAPGVLMLPMNLGLGVFFAGCGGAVAALTHRFCTKARRPPQGNPVHGPA